MARIIIIPKFLNAPSEGLREEFIDPICNPEDNLAPRILTRSPLSPENKGTKARILGLLKITEKLLFRMVPAVVPRIEDKKRAGVLCFIIFLRLLPPLIPTTNPSTPMIMKIINKMISKNPFLIHKSICTARRMDGRVKRSPEAAIKGVVTLSGSQPFS